MSKATLLWLGMIANMNMCDEKVESAEPIRHTDLFVAGTDGYHTFRIPSLLITPRGTALAFSEGRKNGRGDTGDIDLVMKRSPDRGVHWSNLRVIADNGPNTIGNPCPVLDRATGTIWLLLTANLGADKEDQILAGTSRGTRTVWVMSSRDEGASWTKPVEITASTKRPDWTWYATGPGVAIQLESGRLLVPCDHYVAVTKEPRAHVIFSDDHGASWRIGGIVKGGVNECQAVELSGGSVLLNMRNHPPRKGAGRAVATSIDGGLTFFDPNRDSTLIEPGCQASLVRYTTKAEHGKDRLLFSNPASARREKMTVRVSYDEGQTWRIAKTLHSGPAAYSCLGIFPDGSIGCLYEQGAKSPYEKIALAIFSLEWLTGGTDRYAPSAP